MGLNADSPMSGSPHRRFATDDMIASKGKQRLEPITVWSHLSKSEWTQLSVIMRLCAVLCNAIGTREPGAVTWSNSCDLLKMMDD
jgi:hypothetical protein